MWFILRIAYLPGSGFGFASGSGRGIAGLISGTKIIHSNIRSSQHI